MRTWFRVTLGVALGAGLLWIALAQVDTDAAAAAMLNADPRFLAVGLGLYWCDISLRILRWRGLLKITKPLAVPQVGQVLIVGYAVNNVLPARLGEIFRADFLRRQFAVSRSAAVGSIVIERLLDGAVVVGLFLLGIALVNFQHGVGVLLTAAAMGAAAVLAVAIGVGTLPSYYERLPFSQVSWIKPRLTAFVSSLAVMRTGGFATALVLSVVIWAVECGAIAMVIQACGVRLGLPELWVVVGAASLSTLLPSAPGYIGSLQIAYVAAFTALDEGAEAAIAAATLTQVVLLGSITVVGLAILAHVYFMRPAAPAGSSPK